MRIEKPIIEEIGQSSFVIEYLTYVNMTMPLQLAGGKTKEGRGVIESAWGCVEKFDSTYKQIKLKNDDE